MSSRKPLFIIQALLPLLAPGAVVFMLKNGNFFPALQTHLAALCGAKRTQTPVLVRVVEMGVTHEANWFYAHCDVFLWALYICLLTKKIKLSCC